MTTTEITLLWALCRDDLYAFARKMFAEIYPGQTFKGAPYLELLAFRFASADLNSDRPTYQIFNLPPRMLKSYFVTICFSAWILGKNPKLQIMIASHTLGLASALLAKIRQIVNSSTYRTIFPGVDIVRDNEIELELSSGGGVLAVSFGSAPTGRGCDILTIDDPTQANDSDNVEVLDKAYEFFNGALLSRLNHSTHHMVNIVMQRLSPRDLAGRLEDNNLYEKLSLPLEATEDEDLPYGDGKRFTRAKGHVLNPARLTSDGLMRLKDQTSDTIFAAQYQQRPIIGGRAAIKPEHLVYVKRPLRGSLVQSWDIASSMSDKAAYSVGLTFAIDGDRVQLIHVLRDRIPTDDIGQVARRLYREYKPRCVLVEVMDAGHLVTTALRTKIDGAVVIPIKPRVSKLQRLEECRGMFVEHRFLLPEVASWLDDYVSELLSFPHGRYADQVDATTQFLTWYLECADGGGGGSKFPGHPPATGGGAYDGGREIYRSGRGFSRGTQIQTMRPKFPRKR